MLSFPPRSLKTLKSTLTHWGNSQQKLICQKESAVGFSLFKTEKIFWAISSRPSKMRKYRTNALESNCINETSTDYR